MLLREVRAEDHPALLALWQAAPGVQLRSDDQPVAFSRYLARNPGLNLLVEQQGRVIACLLAGEDGRRGYLQHLVVHPDFRRQGIARQLLQAVLQRLAVRGIGKSHVFVLDNAPQALAFWRSQAGWSERRDIHVFSTLEHFQ